MQFAYLEKHPLTEKQYAACVSDAKTTLVLAGAGTGKTSTLLGRIVYLYETAQSHLGQILSLAFGVDAANEVQQRVESLQDKLTSSSWREEVKDFKARTFHSLGLYIVGQVERKRPNLTSLSEEHVLQSFLFKEFDELATQDFSYRQWLYHYFCYLEDPSKAYPKRSLNDDYVSHQVELCLANYFYLMGKPYIYHAHYEKDIYPYGKNAPPYRCSFYLPDEQFYIDVWDKNLTREQRQYYQSVHQQYGTKCMFYDDSLDSLKDFESLHTFFGDQNSSKGSVSLHRGTIAMPIARSAGRVSALVERLQKLLLFFKSQGINSACLKAMLSKEEEAEVISIFHISSCLIHLLLPLYESYENHLIRAAEIDFDGMIIKARDYIRRGDFVLPWTDILIDEFQDISLIRLELIQAMQEQCPDLRLFCVGDDWQTIYQFSGSRLSYTREIEQYLGKVSIVALDKTFRFHQGLCDISSQFIQKNPYQYRKEIVALRPVQESIVLVACEKGDGVDKVSEERIQHIFDDIVEQNQSKQHSLKKPLSCLFLARFNHQLPTPMQLIRWQEAYPQFSFKAMSIHASKGGEADYVILLDVNAGEHGLPSEKSSEEFEVEQEDYPQASERRVFYVALTRAKECVYLCYDKDNASCFINELQEMVVLRQLRSA